MAPLLNFQRIVLFKVLEQRFSVNEALDVAALTAAQRPAVTPTNLEFEKVLAYAPKRSAERNLACEPHGDMPPWEVRGVRRDYAEQEAKNLSLGKAGEIFVVMYKRWRLAASGRHELASRVQHISEGKGDGLGFDILSFDENAQERLIEVKTTSSAKETPFFVSQREMEVSSRECTRYALFRVFDFRTNAKIFVLPGAIASHCHLETHTSRASFF